MNKKIVFCILSVIFSMSVSAQCAMCRAVLESEDGHKAAEGINDGIVYLMTIPYILIGGIGYFIYLKYKKLKKE